MRVFIPKLDISEDAYIHCIESFQFLTRDFIEFQVWRVSNSKTERICSISADELAEVFNIKLVKEIVPDETNSAKERSKRLREGYYDNQWDIPRQDI